MASVSALFLLVFAVFEVVGAQQKPSNLIKLGSSLSPTSLQTSWRSPSSRFAFGFYSQGSGFLMGIWLVGKSKNTIVWTVNQDDPPVSSNASLVLTINGELVLRTGQSEEKVIASSSGSSASSASMLDSGNFVLHDEEFKVIWQSFDFPTDTILGGQSLATGRELFSSWSETNSSIGRFRLKMQDDGNLVLYPVNTSDTGIDAYWASDTSNSSWPPHHHLYLNNSGVLAIVNNRNLDQVLIIAAGSSFSSNTIIYRATLDVNGVFRLYSHSFDSGGGETNISVEWSALKDQCEVKGFCGFNSFCTHNDDQPYCRCVPGSDFVDPNQEFAGCAQSFTQERCRGGKETAAFFNMSTMENLTWIEPPYYQASMPTEDCGKSCLEDCNCDVALFEGGNCMKQKLPLKYVTKGGSSTAFFKVGLSTARRENDTKVLPMRPPVVVKTSKKAVVLIIAVCLGFITCSCVSLAISGFLISKTRVLRYRRLLENGNSGLTEEVTLQSFSYSKLWKATNGFKEELGKGSFGTVYRGALYKGKKIVAVKRLEKMVEEGEREFRAEMQAIGRTHHKNLVRLLGYCAEDSKRLLVYEYMSNGSLADLLFKDRRRPDWNERVRIALDVARGILYLHEECEAPIIHCDIKPQNILMDELWTAKISDFGLAKLLMPDQTRTFTVVRGTRGYLAPEWHKNTPISVKADIYSYGIVLLEIVCCRKNMEISASIPDEIVLPAWVYKCFVAKELNKLVGGEEVDKKAFERMVKVGLWCIQDEPALRPSMKSVLLMLEGITDISIPPCPTTTSM